MSQTATTAARTQIAVTRVDADVHVSPQSPAELLEHVPDPWRSRGADVRRLGARSTKHRFIPLFSSGIVNRADGGPPSGLPPGSDPDFLKQQLMEEVKIDFAIMIPLLLQPRAHEEHEAAYASGINSWQADTWLGRYNSEGRFFASIALPRDPGFAVREIERWAGHPGFAQVLLNPFQRDVPLGHPTYHPIYEAASRHGLPVALHHQLSLGFGTSSPVGFSSYYLDSKPVSYPMKYIAHLTSLIFEGVFETYPTLKMALVEGGYLWLAAVMWRLDNYWRELRSEVPLVRRAPSEYISEHVRVTTQPFEQPSDPPATVAHFLRMLEWIDAGRMLMFATDYPHWDGDYKPEAMFARLPKPMQQRIYAGNACSFYGLPTTRAADAP